jgi:hypothetical protein
MSVEMHARIRCDLCSVLCEYWIALPSVDSTIERGGQVSAHLSVEAVPTGWTREYGYASRKDVCPTCTAIAAEDALHAERRARERRELARQKRLARKAAKKEEPSGYR